MFFGCEKVTFSYGKEKVLDNININFIKGQFVALVGDNGSGKSTLMKIMSGIIDEIESGKVYFEDEELNLNNRIKIGYIFQNPENQIVGVTTSEDVAFGLENTGVNREKMKEIIDKSLKMVGLEGYDNVDPNTLSGGQKQRLAIASILAMDPEIIFMDEPTTMLDPIGRKEVYDVIKRLVNMGKTIIISSHHADDLIEVSRIIALKNGKIIFDGNRDDFYKNNKINLEEPFEYKVKSKLNMSYEELVKKICQ